MKTIFSATSFFALFGIFFFVNSTTAWSGALIQEHHLIYEGAFRVPRNNLGGDSTYPQTLARGGAGLTYNAANNSLILTSREKLAVEINIPKPKVESKIVDLNTAVLLQVPGEITNKQWANLKQDGSVVVNGANPGGLLVYNNKLIGSSYAYYDGASEAARSHFTATLNWSTAGSIFDGMHRVGVHPINPKGANGGFVGGYMAHIPSEWQSRLGYPALTGKGALAIISRTSLGPSAWGFDPDNVGVMDPAPAEFLVGYPIDHPTLGTYGGVSLYYNRVTQIDGLVFPAGTDSLLFFGRHGLGMTGEGDTCYGSGTSNIKLHGTPDKLGNKWCYDPADSSKGVHGYPYIYQVWAYDANDLIDVKNGLKNPWDVIPYARWRIDMPFATNMHELKGAAYDPSTKRIFIAQHEVDRLSNPYEPYPIIHVYRIELK